MKKLNTLFFILFFLPLFSFSQDYWEHITTNDTTIIYSILVSNDGTIYYGGIGGLFISNDNGSTWECKHVLFYQVIGSMTFDLDSNLIVGVDNFLYKYKVTEDEWELLFQSDNSPAFRSILVVEDTIYAVSAWGSYRYSNGERENLGRSGDDIVEDSEGRLFIGATSYTGGGGVWQSLDKGETWTLLGLYDSYVQDLAIDSQDRLYAGSIGHQEYGIGGLYRYNREEGTWDTLRLYHRVMSMCFNEEDSLYIGQYTTGGPPAGAFMSPDFGQNWQGINSGLPEDNYNKNIMKLILDSNQRLYALTQNSNAIYRSKEITITSTKGIFQKNNKTIIITPNPSCYNININIKDLNSNFIELSVYSITGKMILGDKIINPTPGGTILYDNIRFLRPGFYIIKIKDSTVTYVTKLIKY